MAKSQIITGLDIGTSAIKALTAIKRSNSSDFEVLGHSQQPSLGIRKGVVVDVDEVAKSVRQVIDQVQSLSDQKIKEVHLNIGGSHIFATPSRGTVVVSRADQKISEEDVSRVVQAAQTFSLPSNKEILDVFPREFIVDGEAGIKEALGMQGLRLEVEILALGAFSPYIKNLTQAVLGAGLQIADVVPSPLAAAKSVLTPQQKELGVILIDIGAGTTGLAVYEEGDLIQTAIFPVGSSHITNDIAIGLQTDIELAERIKREFGSCLVSGDNNIKKLEKIDLLSGDSFSFSRKALADIIDARICEIFDLVQKELKKIPSRHLFPAGVVLTGGGVKLAKLVEFTKKELKLPVQIGVSRGLLGAENDPSWSTACGLVVGAMDFDGQKETRIAGGSSGLGNGLKKLLKIFTP